MKEKGTLSTETQQRVMQVAKYILNGYSKRAFLLQIISENENWNVSERQLDNYIRDAKKVIEYSNSENDIKLEKDIALNRLEGLYVMNMKIQDFNQARQVTMDRLKLLGAFDFKKEDKPQEVEINLTKKTIENINKVLERDY